MKTRILPKKIYVLTSVEESLYVRNNDKLMALLIERFGQVQYLRPEADDTEVQLPDGRVVGRFRKPG